MDARHAPTPSADASDGAAARDVSHAGWRKGLRHATNLWLGSLLLSAAAGCLVFVLLIVPWTIRGFGKADLEIPGILAVLNNNRVWASAGVVFIAGAGIIALMAVRRRLMGLGVYLLCVALLIALAASCILGWWMLYAARLEELSAPM